MELLNQLLEIYKRKHPSDWEDWFNRMASDLIETGDVSKEDYIKFCAENDIFLKPKKSKPTTSYDPCSTSSRPSRGC